MMTKGVRLLAACVAVVSMLAPVPASAAQTSFPPYFSYNINSIGESVAAPAGYLPSGRYFGTEMGLETPFSEPSDICYDDKELIYILDSGNGRIVVADKSFALKGVIEHFTYEGSAVDITGAQGMAVGRDGKIYIADTASGRVLVCGRDGGVSLVIGRPDSALTDSSAPFDVQKVAVNGDGMIYAVAKSINLGIFVFDPQGAFLRFFGSKRIEPTARVAFNYIRKRFMTREQIQGMMQETPVTVTNLDIDRDGFVFVAAPNDRSSYIQPEMVRQLNQKGSNILGGAKPLRFGDDEWDRLLIWQKSMRTDFADIDADGEGYITLLDKGRGKVFVYSQSGQLISAFGGFGDQKGGFIDPAALETVDGSVYVADKSKNGVFRFEPTQYCRSVKAAAGKLAENDLDGALDAWNRVLARDTNNIYAYYSIGTIHDAKGAFREAMDCFKIANAQKEYSDSFREYRKDFVNRYFLLILFGGLLALGVLLAAVRLLKRRTAAAEGSAFSRMESKYRLPFYCMLRPIDGFEQFRYRGNDSLRAAGVFVALWFLIQTLQYFLTGFSFNNARPIDFSFPVTLVRTVGIFALFVIANWAICTLLDGKGNLKQIVCAASYSLLPLLFSMLVNVVLSNVLTVQEASFLGIVSFLGLFWSGIMLVCGLYSIHQYSFLKTALSIVFTVVGIVIIIFLLIMFYTLLQQTWNFINSIILEVTRR